jgi:hypothetical protein
MTSEIYIENYTTNKGEVYYYIDGKNAILSKKFTWIEYGQCKYHDDIDFDTLEDTEQFLKTYLRKQKIEKIL